MANEFPINNTGKPLQTIPYSEKTKDWYKDCANYFLTRSRFNFGLASTGGTRDVKALYDIYNSRFPMEWFKHITDPLSARVEAHKSFPAKIRPVTILRTNIDLLLGEYSRRPFIYNVVNHGEDGYNSYTEGLIDQIHANINEHFVITALQQMAAQGQEITGEAIDQLRANPPLPAEIAEQYHATYKDARAIKAQKWLRRKVRECFVRKKLHKCFKDYLIAGEAYTYKGVINSDLVYWRVSPLCIDYDRSPEEDFVEDAEWVTARYLMTLADVVDNFYADMSAADLKDLELNYGITSPTGFYDYLNGIYTDPVERNKVPVFHIQWKGRKKVGILKFPDLTTGEMMEREVDEDYLVDKLSGETVEWRWMNEAYEVWKIGYDARNTLFLRNQALPVQRNLMNNKSACKLSYNGRKHSDTHSENISILELGIPFQILYIITTYTLEKTIAKSKGKIMFIDQNAIPNEGDWDDEKFFYYSEALGYGLLNRNQIGVDKTWNQYQVVDMSLFDQIKQLIELQEAFKSQWDDVIGITRQRKGQQYASDSVGGTERSVFQSTVITDQIFFGFEEFQQRELQGIIDYSKFLTSKGLKAIYNDDEFNTELLEIEPEDFATAEFGVFVDDASEHMRKLQEMRAMAQAMLQNNSTPSTMLEVIDAMNVSELKTKLKAIEEIERNIAEQQADNEAEREQQLEEIRNRHLAYQNLLKKDLMEAEYDRKEDIEHIKGTYNIFSYQKEADDNEVGDVVDAQSMLEGQQKLVLDQANKTREMFQKDAERDLKRRELDQRIKESEHGMKLADEELKLKKKDSELKKQKLKIDAKKAAAAARKPKTSSK